MLKQLYVEARFIRTIVLSVTYRISSHLIFSLHNIAWRGLCMTFRSISAVITCCWLAGSRITSLFGVDGGMASVPTLRHCILSDFLSSVLINANNKDMGYV